MLQRCSDAEKGKLKKEKRCYGVHGDAAPAGCGRDCVTACPEQDHGRGTPGCAAECNIKAEVKRVNRRTTKINERGTPVCTAGMQQKGMR